MQLILSSGSPRRKELLSLFGIPFKIKVPDIPEIQKSGESPRTFCLRISKEKVAYISKHHPQDIIIGADTIVVIDKQILGKPCNTNQAHDFLKLLQERSHEVLTGYTIALGNNHISRAVKSKVHFRPMTEQEISWYISTGEPMDKAGAYALQGIGSMFIKKVSGCYTNVIGLPLSYVFDDLKKLGLKLQSSSNGGLTHEWVCTGD